MEHVKLLSFYKLYDWMIEELGACTDAALIAVIYSFEENGLDCRMSYAQLAEILKVNRRKVITRISNLESAGYITVTKDSTKTNVYSVNRAMFSTSDQNGTSTSDQNGTSTSDQNGTSTSDQNGTSTSDQNGTQIENNREIKENKKRESARAHDTAAFSPIPNHEEIKLTAEQQRELQREVTGTGRSLESYFRSLEKSMKSNGKSYEPHYETLRDWMQRDKDKAEQQRKAKGQSSNSSSIDDADLEKVFPGRGSCTG